MVTNRMDRPKNYYLRRSKKTGVRAVFIRARTPVIKSFVVIPRKSVTRQQLVAYVARLRKPIKVKLIYVPARKDDERDVVWRRRNRVALQRNWKMNSRAMKAERQNQAKAIVIEHIAAVVGENPLISREDLKFEVYRRVKQDSTVRTSLSQQLLTPAAILEVYKELLRKRIIIEKK